MNTQLESHTKIPNQLKFLVRATWLIVVAFLLVTFVVGLAVRLNHLQQPVSDTDVLITGGLFSPAQESVFTARLGAEEVQALQSLGLSLSFYAIYIVSFDVMLLAVGLVTGLLIFVRRAEDWMALWFSLLVILIGTNGITVVTASLVLLSTDWFMLITLIGFLGMISNLHVLFLSPDGRFVPRWTLTVGAGFVGFMFALSIYAVFAFLRGAILAVILLVLMSFGIWFSLILMGIGTQIYRYLRVSDVVQRQQTKWVAIGLGAVATGFTLNNTLLYLSSEHSGLARVIYNLARLPLANLIMMLFPICVAFAIFRYHLWDIDVIVRRTVTYSILTAILGFVYFGAVVALQQIFRALTNAGGELAIIISTLAIAALFNPLRTRIQNLIDRRFYRRKYDAQQVLANFARTARDETDLNKLTDELIRVADETMQPENVSLWFKTSGVRTRGEKES